MTKVETEQMAQDIVGLVIKTIVEDSALEYEEFRWARSSTIRCP